MEEITLTQKVTEAIKERKKKVEEGSVNCIPSPFVPFRNDFTGIEQACYYLVTSSTKGGKSQFTSYTFIYEPLMWLFEHPEINIDIKVLYFPLEETQERIMQRFLSWIIYRHTKGNVRVSPRELRSTQKPLSKEILNIIESPEIQRKMKFFEEHVIFPLEQSYNPTGIYYACKRYAEEHGKVTTKKGFYKDEFGVTKETQVFDKYEQDNPNEYRLIIIDTINLIDLERGMTLKQSIDKLSEYLAKYLRNRYHFSPVVIQQQAMEGESNEAVKLNRIRPTIATLGDSKYGARDSNVVLGLFSPFKYSLSEYMGYDITKFRDSIRFVEVLVSRDGEMGGIAPLYFDGAVCEWKMLPAPNDTNSLVKYYTLIAKNRKE